MKNFLPRIWTPRGSIFSFKPGLQMLWPKMLGERLVHFVEDEAETVEVDLEACLQRRDGLALVVEGGPACVEVAGDGAGPAAEVHGGGEVYDEDVLRAGSVGQSEDEVAGLQVLVHDLAVFHLEQRFERAAG